MTENIISVSQQPGDSLDVTNHANISANIGELHQHKLSQYQNKSHLLLSSGHGHLFDDELDEVDRQHQSHIDTIRLEHAVRDAGEHAYGISAIEVWMLDTSTGKLIRPGTYPAFRAAGWWSNPSFPRTDALRRLDDPNDANYDDPSPCSVGCDLAGILYRRENGSDHRYHSKSGMFHRNVKKDDALGKSGIGTKDYLSSSYPPPPIFRQSGMFRRSITKDDALSRSGMFHRIGTQDDVLGFQDINSILQDPDSAKTHRLDLILEAGFSHAAGAHFHTGGVDGIVIFYTSFEANSTSDSSFIRSAPNSFCLIFAAEIIGAVLSSIGPCHDIGAIKKIKINSSKTGVISTSNQDEDGFISKGVIQKGLKMWWSKCHGGNLQIPPAFSWGEAMYTLIGSLISLLLLLLMARFFVLDGKPLLDIGSITAALGLQFMLSSAPAAQPRSIILGSLFAGAISKSLTYIPKLPIFARQAIAPAISMFVMVKISAPCPPMASFAISMASGNHSWTYFAVSVCANILLLIPATLINNLSKKRQYPTYWFYPLPKRFFSSCRNNKS